MKTGGRNHSECLQRRLGLKSGGQLGPQPESELGLAGLAPWAEVVPADRRRRRRRQGRETDFGRSIEAADLAIPRIMEGLTICGRDDCGAG